MVLSLADVRRIWPDLLEQVKKMRRFTWILLSQNAQVIGVDATSLTVGFKTAGARDSFVGGGSEEILRQAAIDMIGADWQIEVAVDPSAQPGQETAPRVIRPAVADRSPRAERGRQLAGAHGSAQLGQRRRARGPGKRRAGRHGPRGASRARPPGSRRARRPSRPPAPSPRPAPATSRRAPRAPTSTRTPTETIPPSEDNGLDSTQLLERELGATVIEEIPHD